MNKPSVAVAIAIIVLMSGGYVFYRSKPQAKSDLKDIKGAVPVSEEKHNSTPDDNFGNKVSGVIASGEWPQEIKERVATKQDAYDLLFDKRSSHLWPELILFIRKISPNDEGVEVLTKFFEEGVSEIDKSVFLAKSRVPESVGRIGGARADSFLKRLLTEEGARELTAKWANLGLKDDPQADSERLIASFRAKAALGLAHTFEERNIEPVRKLYEELRRDLAKTPYAENKPYAEIVSRLDKNTINMIAIWSGAISALAQYDCMTDIGEENYWELSFEKKFEKMGPYIAKYDIYGDR